MTDYNLWKQNIHSAIDNIADIKFQEEAWLGKSARYVSSFGEDISMLYDSFCFADEFWEKENITQFHFSKEIIAEMKLLKEMIDKYLKDYAIKKTPDEIILKDTEWHKIVNQAKKIIDLWDI